MPCARTPQVETAAPNSRDAGLLNGALGRQGCCIALTSRSCGTPSVAGLVPAEAVRMMEVIAIGKPVVVARGVFGNPQGRANLCRSSARPSLSHSGVS